MPYANEHSARVRDPKDFQEDSFRRKNISDGIDIIIGKLKGEDSTTTQAYRFDAQKFTPKEAKKWLKDNDVEYISFEEATNGKNIDMKITAFNKTFQGRNELFNFIKNNSREIISFKKAAVKFSEPVSYNLIHKSEAVKSLIPNEEIKYGSIVYPVINTTNYMDMHDDVHLNSIWNKSAKEQQGKIYFVTDHKLEVDKVISRPNEVEMIVKEMNWSDLGKNYEGSTEALIFKAKLTERSMKEAFIALKENDPVEYSVRMIYVDLDVAINNDTKDFKEEYGNWIKYFPLIANKERADERGFFFPIFEAKIFKEGSMVLAGSNDATMTLYDIEDKIQPPENTVIEPLLSTQKIKEIIHEQFKNLIK